MSVVKKFDGARVGGGRDRFDRRDHHHQSDDNAKCFVLCEFQKKNQLQSESVVKEGAVTKRVSGIFVEATVDDSIKSDFDRENDQAKNESSYFE